MTSPSWSRAVPLGSGRALARVVPQLALVAALGVAGCADPPPIVVTSVEDTETPPEGEVTLRSALREALSGQAIVFDPSLDGATIELSIVGEPRTRMPAEVMGIRMEPSGPVSYLRGYFERDYGASALFARKNVVLDASQLKSGVTLAWTGGENNPARVLAVHGNLVLEGVTLTGGLNVAEDIDTGEPDAQPWSLARGGGVAVWGVADLSDCTVHGNRVEGDFDPSRDRGAYGGGVYANIVRMRRCIVSGNSAVGGGAAGGGVFSVGGAQTRQRESWIAQSSITGNRISGLFTYGGGVYSDGGGIGNRKRLRIENSTVARNVVEPAPNLPPFLLGSGYWRGGGVYASNGYLEIKAATIVENQVHGVARTDSLDRPNLAGGVAATIGNAHAVEDLLLGHSIIAGNTVHEVGGQVYAQDVFTGSFFYFRSLGFNRIGEIDFSQMLVPVGKPGWASLSRRHFPQRGDVPGVALEDVVDLEEGVARSPSLRSAGTDAGEQAVLSYAPGGSALDRVPAGIYRLDEVLAEYAVRAGGSDDFLAITLGRIEQAYELESFADDFTDDFEAFLASVDLNDDKEGRQPYLNPDGEPILTLADTHWFGPAQTWPKELANHPWIHFWHRLDDWLLDAKIPGVGPEAFGDRMWRTLFASGPLVENPGITVRLWERNELSVRREPVDQTSAERADDAGGDIGAIELR